MSTTEAPIQQGRFTAPLREFIATQHAGAALLLAATCIALAWANSPWAASYERLWGMTLAVEPMVTAGRPAVEFKDSARWTVATKDGSNAAHFEHTIAVTPSGNSVLTDGR